MGIHIALNHKTTYKYDQLINLARHIVRLRPAPHCRTPILSYSMRVTPGDHYINWQQDPFSNYLGRLVFHEKTDEFSVEIDLVADMIIAPSIVKGSFQDGENTVNTALAFPLHFRCPLLIRQCLITVNHVAFGLGVFSCEVAPSPKSHS